MDLSVVLSAFSLLFLAEMGGKSQLLAITLAHRYRAGPVIAGTFAAFALLNLLAVFVGQALFESGTGDRARVANDDADDEEPPAAPRPMDSLPRAMVTSPTKVPTIIPTEKEKWAKLNLRVPSGALNPRCPTSGPPERRRSPAPA